MYKLLSNMNNCRSTPIPLTKTELEIRNIENNIRIERLKEVRAYEQSINNLYEQELMKKFEEEYGMSIDDLMNQN